MLLLQGLPVQACLSSKPKARVVPNRESVAESAQHMIEACGCTEPMLAEDGKRGSLSIADVSVSAPGRGCRNLVCVESSSSRPPGRVGS